jgi:hypothetical protein
MTATGPDQADDDLAAITATPLAKLAGGLLIGLGAFDAVLALQSWLLLVRAPVPALLLVLSMIAAAPVCVFLGWKVARLYGWASLAGSAAAGVTGVVALSWALFAFFNGVVALLAFALVPLSLAASVVSGLCIDAGRRADAARERLRDQGLEAGI